MLNNLLTKKLYQSKKSFGLKPLYKFLLILILGFLFLPIKVSANQSYYIPKINSYNLGSIGEGKKLIKITSNQNIQGCKDTSGTVSNIGSIFIPATALAGGGYSYDINSNNQTKAVVICNPAPAKDSAGNAIWGTIKAIDSTKISGGELVLDSSKYDLNKVQSWDLNNFKVDSLCEGGATDCSYNNATTNTKNLLKKAETCVPTYIGQGNYVGCTGQVTSIFSNLDQKVKSETEVQVENSANPPPPSGTLTTDSGCSYVSPDSGQQSDLLQVNLAGLGDEQRCQCVTEKAFPLNNGQNGVYKIDGAGNKKEFTKVKSDDPAYNTAKEKCLKENTARFYNNTSKACYSSLKSCKEIQSCEGHKDQYLLAKGDWLTFSEINAEVSSFAQRCSGGKGGQNCLNNPQQGLQRCSCSVYNNPEYDPIWCGVGIGNCSPVCLLVPAKLTTLQPTRPESPLAFIKVVANFLFWFAVILFFINFITAGIEMVQSGDEPEKMKEATERVNSTIFGFVFVLIVAGLINYLITFVGTFIN